MKEPLAILFANLKGNLGDFAILHASILQLNNAFPGHPVHVFPHDSLPIDKERLEAFRDSGVPSFELREWAYSKQFPESLKGFRQIGLGPFLQARFMKQLTAEAGKDAERFSAYKAIFVSGGAQWGPADTGNAMLAGINAMGAHNKIIFTFPFSIQSKVVKVHSAQKLRSYFNSIQEPFYVRDSSSKKIVDRLGLDCVCEADCVFSLKYEASNILPAPNVEKDKIVLILTKDRSNLYKKLRNIIPHLLKDFKVELLTTCERVDGQFCNKLSKEFSIPFHAPLTWQATVAQLKSSSLLISNRLHGVIFGMLAGIPILPLVNRPKVRAVVDDAKFEFYAKEVQEIAPDLIGKVMDNKDAVLATITHYLNRSEGKIAIPTECPKMPSAEVVNS